MSSIKLIAGLANPGAQYAATRHNIGSRYIQLLAERYHQLLNCTPKFFGYTANLLLDGKNIYLLVPTIFVNLSGKSIAAMTKFYHLQPEEIMIVHDEMNFQPGIAKFKQGGSHGGHNGLKDIINQLNNNSFYRLRIGIGHPGTRDKVINFVLSKPPVKEQKLIDCAIHEAIFCTELWLKDNKIKAINRLNSFKAELS